MTYSLFVGAGQWQAAASETATQGFFGLDGDAQWQPLSNGLPDQVEVRSIVLHPDCSDTIYAGTQRGPYRSKDAGESWHSLTLPEGTPDEDRVVLEYLSRAVRPGNHLCGHTKHRRIS